MPVHIQLGDREPNPTVPSLHVMLPISLYLIVSYLFLATEQTCQVRARRGARSVRLGAVRAARHRAA